MFKFMLVIFALMLLTPSAYASKNCSNYFYKPSYKKLNDEDRYFTSELRGVDETRRSYFQNPKGQFNFVGSVASSLAAMPYLKLNVSQAALYAKRLLSEARKSQTTRQILIEILPVDVQKYLKTARIKKNVELSLEEYREISQVYLKDLNPDSGGQFFVAVEYLRIYPGFEKASSEVLFTIAYQLTRQKNSQIPVSVLLRATSN